MRERLVVLLCGPPGAGKTTAARASGLRVYDRDEAAWSGEREFTSALDALAYERGARAVVIRTAATSSARRRAAERIAATHTYLLLASREDLHRRNAARGRDDRRRTAAGIDTWFARFDRDDAVPAFPGWRAVLDGPGLGVLSQW